MTTELWRALRAAPIAFLLCSCATTATQQKSTGTNWLSCDVDEDCAVVQGASCNIEHVCVDATGKAIVKTAVSIPESIDAGVDAISTTTMDGRAICPNWSSLTDAQGFPNDCTERGLICTYPDGQAECAISGQTLKWWTIGNGVGCPERRPSSGSPCSIPGRLCGYISGSPYDADFVVNSCCDGDHLVWEPEPTGGCPNGNVCGTINASDYDQSCAVDADCIQVTDGDLCSTHLCECNTATISASAEARYKADYSKKKGSGVGSCPCAFVPTPVCKRGVCTMPSFPGGPAIDGG
jgi:hypothetical protein